MKKLIAALAICVGTAAFANDTAGDKVQKEQQAQQSKTRDATQVFTQQPGDSIRESQRDAEKGVDATEVGPKIGKAAKDATGMQTESEGTFKAAQAFSLTGTLKDKTMEGVTIERKGLPAADLDIRDKTALWLDGKKVSKDALPEGAQVRAKFQLEGQDIVAVELRATSPKGTKAIEKDSMNKEGTGGAGLRDDARDLGNDVKSGAKDVGKDVKDSANDTSEDINKPLK
ncbi:hypothetical protein [Hyalangium versicolor]|uniref:hypothetical protein n=1 Tax=Hyalangium versicolor TaxID=2861190 RepID=UPI001CCD1856|nr:hypothetical protein [Hyalangium versicolor]